MPFAPDHRWFRFSLRTLFVVVTVIVTAWIGWNASIVQSRRALRAQYNIGFVRPSTPIEGGSPRSLRIVVPSASPDIPLIRRWLGDEAATGIIVFDEADFEPVNAAFPEARVELHMPPIPAKQGTIIPDFRALFEKKAELDRRPKNP